MLCRSAISGTQTEGTHKDARPEQPGVSRVPPASQPSPSQPSSGQELKLKIPVQVRRHHRSQTPGSEEKSHHNQLLSGASKKHSLRSQLPSSTARWAVATDGRAGFPQAPPDPSEPDCSGARGPYHHVARISIALPSTALFVLNICQYSPDVGVYSQTCAAYISAAAANSAPQNRSCTVEKLDDVCKIHVVLQDDVPVHFHQGQGYEEHVVCRGNVCSCPDGLPDGEHVVVHQLC